MKQIQKLQLQLLVLLFVVTGFSQKRADRFDGTVPPGIVNEITGENFVSRTNEINTLLNSFGSSGGKIEISGNISLKDIKLKSNVHVNVLKGSVIKLETGGRTVFELNKQNGVPTITNVKIGCSDCTDNFADNKDSSKRFTIDLSDVAPHENARAVMIANVTNYSVSHFIIKDNYTRLTNIATLPVINVPRGTEPRYRKTITVEGVPTQGDLKYVHVVNAHSGYGLVQTQVGQNLNFHHLSSEGGITLRLESGANVSDVPATQSPILNLENIEGYEIECERGLCAVLTQPHNRTQGVMTIENIESTGCAANVILAPGFKDRSLAGLPDEEYGCETCDFKDGTFENIILKGTIKHTFASTAQNEKKLYNFYTKDFINGETFEEKFSDPIYESPFEENIPVRSNTPSIANILYRAKLAADIDIVPLDGQYQLSFENETITTLDVPNSQSCIGDIMYFNDRKLDCGTLSSQIINESTNEVTYDNNLQLITLNSQSPVAIDLYNVLGALVASKTLSNRENTLNVSSLNNGIYFVKIDNSQLFKFVKN
ncbi:T9SS type A sorting domain-containing protein [Wenyingzhuangia sp. IMCC45533]